MTQHKQWTGIKNNHIFPVGETAQQLPPAFYKIMEGNMFTPSGFKMATVNHDMIIVTGLAKQVLADFDKFQKAKDKYSKFGFLHKRGLLLIGDPGTGKTMTAMMLCEHVIAKGGVALSAPRPDTFEGDAVEALSSAFATIRMIHPHMPIVNVMEDIEQYGTSILGVLDGENQVNNIFHVGVTNHPDKLDGTMLNRPGRFDDVIWVEAPSLETRIEYLKRTLPEDTDLNLIKEIATASEGFLLSHVHDLVNSIFVLDRSVDDAVTKIKGMIHNNASNEKRKEEKSKRQYYMLPSSLVTRG